MKADKPIAHVSEDGGCHGLVGANLVFARIVDLTARFAAEFGCGAWGRLAGKIEEKRRGFEIFCTQH